MRPHRQGLGRPATVGLELVLSIVLGLWAGRWLDGKIHGRGLGTLIGFALGAGVGFLGLYRVWQSMRRDAKAMDEKAQRPYEEPRMPGEPDEPQAKDERHRDER